MRSALAARMYAAVQLSSQQQQMYVKRIVKKMQLIIYQRFIILWNGHKKEFGRKLVRIFFSRSPCGWDALCIFSLFYFFSEVFSANFYQLRHLHNRTTNFEVEKNFLLSRDFFCALAGNEKKGKIQKLSIDGQAMKVARLFLVFL